jgi:hypothetical protein
MMHFMSDIELIAFHPELNEHFRLNVLEKWGMSV